MDLGSGNTLDLTGMGTSAGVYRLISGSSLANTFTTVTGLSSNYLLVYNTLNPNELDAQHKADQSISSTSNLRMLVGSTLTLANLGTLTNVSPSGKRRLEYQCVQYRFGRHAGEFRQLRTHRHGGGRWQRHLDRQYHQHRQHHTGLRAALPSAIPMASAVTSTVSTSRRHLDVVATRTLTNATVTDLGRVLTGSSISTSSNATGHIYGTGGTGAHTDTEDSTVAAYTGSTMNGLTLTGGPTTLNTNADVTGTISGNITGTGTVNGTFTLNVTPEFSSATTVDIGFTADPRVASGVPTVNPVSPWVVTPCWPEQTLSGNASVNSSQWPMMWPHGKH